MGHINRGNYWSLMCTGKAAFAQKKKNKKLWIGQIYQNVAKMISEGEKLH